MPIIKMSELYGQSVTIELLLDRLKNLDTFPRFIILEGEEGLGKTSIAKIIAMSIRCINRNPNGEPCYECDNCKAIINETIIEGVSSHNVYLYKLASAGGKDTINEMITSINTKSVDESPRVFIGDEAHRMSEAAQDALLCDAETLPDNVFLIFCTTEIHSLNKSLVSRATKYKLRRLSNKEMRNLILNEIRKDNLILDYQDIIINLISEAAENKPREAISILNSMKDSSRLIKLEKLKLYLGVEQSDELLGIIEALDQPIHIGLSRIQDLTISANTQSTLVMCLSSIISLKSGGESKIDVTGMSSIPNTEDLITLLYNVSCIEKMDKTKLTGAFVKSHRSYETLVRKDSADKFEMENEAITHNPYNTEWVSNSEELKTIDELIGQGRVVEN